VSINIRSYEIMRSQLRIQYEKNQREGILWILLKHLFEQSLI
jgi:hypothetical protein